MLSNYGRQVVGSHPALRDFTNVQPFSNIQARVNEGSIGYRVVRKTISIPLSYYYLSKTCFFNKVLANPNIEVRILKIQNALLDPTAKTVLTLKSPSTSGVR